MTSILFLLETIECNQIRRIYLKKKKTFSQFFCVFLKFRSNFERSPKKMTLIAYIFPKIGTP